MLKKNVILFIVIFLFIGFSLLRVFSTCAKNYHKKIKSHTKIYCHSDRFKDYVWVIEDLKYSADYIKHFQSKSRFPRRISFKTENIPNNSEVYLLSYEKDSTLAKIACYYSKNGFGKIVEGYIFSKWLYKKQQSEIVNTNGDNLFFPKTPDGAKMEQW